MAIPTRKLLLLTLPLLITAFMPPETIPVQQKKDGSMVYIADAQGNTIPDFSRVGYHQGDKELPLVPVVKTVFPAASGDSQKIIQDAIDEVAARQPDRHGWRGAILLKKGTYIIPGRITISTSGIVLRGEGADERGTKILASGRGQRPLIEIKGDGRLIEAKNKVAITDAFVPVGSHVLTLSAAGDFKVGDKIIVYRPAQENWIHDIKMDQIEARADTRQWRPEQFTLKFERNITRIEGNRIFIDNPVVMQMDQKYGGGKVYKYEANRVSEVGVENLYLESAFAGDTDEDHAWTAVELSGAENCWVRNITSRYFGFGCVDIRKSSKCVTVTDSKCLDARSIITGSRRYSFNIDGQLNLVRNCEASDGRHDFVTGAMVCGPNVFYNSTAVKTHSNIGPHHRWAVGTLYDNIRTDGAIDIEDRGNYGTGHGWAGVTQVLWNCTAKTTSVQSPWASGKNYSFGSKCQKTRGRFTDRPDGEWFALNADISPASLYLAQLAARKAKKNK